MDALIQSFCKMRLQTDTPVPKVTKSQLVGVVQHLYVENTKLKKEIIRLRKQLHVHEPTIARWQQVR